jgi:hypothetical protein
MIGWKGDDLCGILFPRNLIEIVEKSRMRSFRCAVPEFGTRSMAALHYTAWSAESPSHKYGNQ